MNFSRFVAFNVFIFMCVLGCKRDETFDAIGLEVAFPIDVSTSANGEYFYVLNADFDRSYNGGSVLVIDEEGDKVNSIAVPRLGRGMSTNGEFLAVWYEKADENVDTFQLEFFDLSDPANPLRVKTFDMISNTSVDTNDHTECNAVQVALPRAGSDYPYFAVSCRNGDLWMGEFGSDGMPSEIHPVRNYAGSPRRALYIDPVREKVFAFVTDLGVQDYSDRVFVDVMSYDAESERMVDGKNGVPDDLEDTLTRRRNSVALRQRFQVAIYDVAAGAAQGFEEYKRRNVDNMSEFDKELKYIFFTLENSDGTPDTEYGRQNQDVKHYRTNFWSVVPHPTLDNILYLSHRGKKSDATIYANNVIEVDLGEVAKWSSIEDDTLLDTLMGFKRVYGFGEELDPDHHFPAEIKVQTIGGELVLIVNHFKDLVNFGSSASFSIAAKTLDGLAWVDEVRSYSKDVSFFQFAVNARGKVLAASVYGDALIPLELKPGVGITVGWNQITKID